METIEQLKALAYDQLVAIEQGQDNLKLLVARINELQTQGSQKAEEQTQAP